MDVINLQEKLSLIHDLWHPGIIAQINDYHIKVAKVKGEFSLHEHPDTDELFLVLEGCLTIALPDGDVTVNEGELFVVPAGIVHQPRADHTCAIPLFEPAGTRNTGDVTDEKTVEVTWL